MRDDAERIDDTESFWFAEVLKYLWVLSHYLLDARVNAVKDTWRSMIRIISTWMNGCLILRVIPWNRAIHAGDTRQPNQSPRSQDINIKSSAWLYIKSGGKWYINLYSWFSDSTRLDYTRDVGYLGKALQWHSRAGKAFDLGHCTMYRLTACRSKRWWRWVYLILRFDLMCTIYAGCVHVDLSFPSSHACAWAMVVLAFILLP